MDKSYDEIIDDIRRLFRGNTPDFTDYPPPPYPKMKLPPPPIKGMLQVSIKKNCTKKIKKRKK